MRATVIGSYPLPGWLEHAVANLADFGPADIAELQEDAVRVAVADQLDAGLDVVTDGEQTRLDFNLSFYGSLGGIEREEDPGRRFGPPAHDQRGRHAVIDALTAPCGLGVVAELERLQRLAPEGPTLKISVPGPYTLAGRLLPSERYPDRFALTEALLPIVRDELVAIVDTAAQEVAIDEPSMSCYAYREDPARLVDIFNRTVAPIRGRTRICTHLCFGNYKARAAAPRSYAPLLPAFLDLAVDELHLEMASREFAELELIEQVAKRTTVAVGVIDVKSSYIETPEDVAARIRRCLRYVPPERLVLAPDCGLSQTPRWAARAKLASLVEGTRRVQHELDG